MERKSTVLCLLLFLYLQHNGSFTLLLAEKQLIASLEQSNQKTGCRLLPNGIRSGVVVL